MRKIRIPTLALCLTLGLSPIASLARLAQAASQSAPVADKTAPSYDMKAQSIEDLKQLRQKYVSLAEAIPADKYAWLPAPGVRSIAELLLHVAAANYNFPTMIGTPPAPGFQANGFEKSTTDKAKIIEQLNKSFAYAIASVQAMSNADFAKSEKKLGPDANDGDVIYIMVVHSHEHMGQSIAYARSNGVVPPWTADALKKDPKAQAE
jgi:uncharacterized damage-inducible protein DinB